MNIDETKAAIAALPDDVIFAAHQDGDRADEYPDVYASELLALAADHSRLERESARLREGLELLVESPEYFCGASGGDHAQDFCECQKLRRHAKAALEGEQNEA